MQRKRDGEGEGGRTRRRGVRSLGQRKRRAAEMLGVYKARMSGDKEERLSRWEGELGARTHGRRERPEREKALDSLPCGSPTYPRVTQLTS